MGNVARNGSRALGILVVVGLISCDQATAPPSHERIAPDGVLSTLSDGTGGDGGFYVLSPLVDAAPSIDEPFNPGLPVRIEICELDAGRACVGLVRSFAPSEVAVDVAGEFYKAVWQTGEDGLNTEVDYRVTWLVAGEALGYRDVNPDEGGSASDPAAHVFNNGSSLPLKAFVGISALCEPTATACGAGVVDLSAGGTILVADLEDGTTTAGLQVPSQPAGGPSGSVVLVAQQLPLSPDDCLGPNMDAVVFSPCLDISEPSGVLSETNTLVEPAVVSICIDEDAIQALRGLTEAGVHTLQIAKYHDDDESDPVPGFVQVLPNAAENVCGGTGQAMGGGPLTRFARAVRSLVLPRTLYAVDLGVGGMDPFMGVFSRYAFFQPGTLDIARGDDPTQVVMENTTLPIDPAVLVLDGAGLPYPDAGVHFEIVQGDGAIAAPADRLTGTDGEAAIQWTLGSAGVHKLRAYSLGLFNGALPDHHDPGAFIGDLEAASVEFTAYACLPGHGFGPAPAVDGLFGATEWACAESVTFDANISGGTVPAELYWQNDGVNIYFALRIPRPAADKDNGFRIDFDNTLDGASADDDGIAYDPEEGVFLDQFLGDRCLTRGQSGCGVDDDHATGGGTIDGAAAFAHDGTYSVYEMSHPLSGGDARDMALTAGDGFGFYLTLTLGKGAQGNTQWPGFRVFQPVTVAAPIQ